MLDQSWSDLFVQSARKVLDFPDSIDAHIDADMTFYATRVRQKATANEIEAMLPTAMRALMTIEAWRARTRLTNLAEACESPIEVAMGLALVLIAEKQSIVWERIRPTDVEPSTYRGFRGHILCIEPQADIEGCRVDFLLTADVIMRDGSRGQPGRIIVECDGHEFHDRTKEQAQKDRARDRKLQENGYNVFRYTGSEIYEDAFGCAKQAVEAVLKKASSAADQR